MARILMGSPPSMITCWRAEDMKGRLLGGISIEHKGGEFVIGDVAVREKLREQDIGTLLMETAMKRIADEISLLEEENS